MTTTFLHLVEGAMDLAVATAARGIYEDILAELRNGGGEYKLEASWVNFDGSFSSDPYWAGEVVLRLNVQKHFDGVLEQTLRVVLSPTIDSNFGTFDPGSMTLSIFFGRTLFRARRVDLDSREPIDQDEVRALGVRLLGALETSKWRDWITHEITHAVDYIRGVDFSSTKDPKEDYRGYMEHGVETNARFTQTLERFRTQLYWSFPAPVDEFERVYGRTPQEFSQLFWDTFVSDSSMGYEYPVEIARSVMSRAAVLYYDLRREFTIA